MPMAHLLYRYYAATLVAAMAALVVLEAASATSLLPVEPAAIGWIVFPLTGVCLVAGLVLRMTTGRRPIDPPAWLPVRWVYRVRSLFVVAFVALLAVGFTTWPSAPIRRSGALLVDRLGGLHGEAEFHRYQQWNVAYWTAAGMVVFLALVTLPLRRRRATASPQTQVAPRRP